VTDLSTLGRPALLKLRRQINERLAQIEEDKHAAVVAAGINAPPGWGENDKTDGDDNAQEE
jgi:hypothetical protein